MKNFPYKAYRILSAAWRRRYTIILPVLILPFVGLFIGITSPKHYKSHTSMLIQETAKMNPFLEDLAVSAMLKERVEGLKTLLHSRHILQSVAEELGLIDTDTSAGVRDQIISELSGQLSMQMVGKDMIRIDHTASSPEQMKDFLQTVSTHFIEQLLAPERSSIEDSASFLKEHLDLRRLELESAEQALSRFKSQHAEALPELHSLNITRLNQLKQKLAERHAELAGTVKNVGGIHNLLSQTNPVIGHIEEKIVKIRSELTLLRARYTDKHSKVQALSRSLRRLEKEREAAINNTEHMLDAEQLWDIATVSSVKGKANRQPVLISQLENLHNAKNKAESLEEEIKRLETMIMQIESGIRSFGEKASELSKLQRDLDVKSRLYEELLQRYEMAQVTGSLGKFEESKRVKIIDRPFTPSTPSNLPAIVFLIAGIVAGLCLGIGFAILQELLDNSIRFREEVEEITQAPVITRIPPMS